MKALRVLLFLLTICNTSLAGENYSFKDVVYHADDMNAHEFLKYQELVLYSSNDSATLAINCLRAYDNLRAFHPHTLANIHFSPKTDNTQGDAATSGADISIELINTNETTIREIVFYFEFFDNGDQVFDTITSDKYCILKFNNLAGIPKTDESTNKQKLLDCYHYLNEANASEKKPFFNKKANRIALSRVSIVYDDGSESDQLIMMQVESLLKEGPLTPIIKYNTYLRNKKGDENTKFKESEKIYTRVEQLPVFPGGQAALLRFISKNIRYPKEAADRRIQGRVMVRFVVDTKGKVGQIEILKSSHIFLNVEAIRLCKLLPNFIPGRVNGKPVNVFYTLPITFQLTGDLTP